MSEVIELKTPTPLVDRILDDWCQLIERLELNPDQREKIISECYSKVIEYGNEFDKALGRYQEKITFFVE